MRWPIWSVLVFSSLGSSWLADAYGDIVGSYLDELNLAHGIPLDINCRELRSFTGTHCDTLGFYLDELNVVYVVYIVGSGIYWIELFCHSWDEFLVGPGCYLILSLVDFFSELSTLVLQYLAESRD
eukprot:s1137_g13.t1